MVAIVVAILFCIGAILKKLGSNKKDFVISVHANPESNVFTVNLTEYGVTKEEWERMNPWRKKLFLEEVINRDFGKINWIVKQYRNEI